MTYSVVQTKAHGSNTGTNVCPITASGAGNFLYCFINCTGSTAPTSVVDNQSPTPNTWTLAASYPSLTEGGVYCYFLPSASNLGGITSVTVNGGVTGGDGNQVIVEEISGLFGHITAADKTAGQTSSANPATSGTVSTTSQANEFYVGYAGAIEAMATPTWTVGSGWSNLSAQFSFNFAGPVLIFGQLESQEVTSTGTPAATFGNSGTVSTNTVIVTFKESGGASTNNGFLSLIDCGT